MEKGKRSYPNDQAVRDFLEPPSSCRPHTRWWWLGNAIAKDDITWQLEQMHEQGIGGVEQITMQEVYEKGNVPYLSEEYFDLVTHAIREAKRLGMEFSLNFGGPGWVIGGSWVPPEDRSKNMVPTLMVLEGPLRCDCDLPTKALEGPGKGEIRPRDVGDKDHLLAVVAARMVDGILQEDSLTDLTESVEGRRLRWDVPAGRWQVTAFWLQFTGQGHAIDHFDREAMERYCEYLGGRFREAFGEEFGKTVESLFVDSFEVALIDNGIYWSEGLLDRFRVLKGYDLTRYLPAIWWEVGEISPKIRYDVNEFLHQVGLEAFFEPFLGWCERNGVRGRIQPYGFTTDILQGAGTTHLPEMEITAGEKDAVPWFDTRIGPKKYVSSGAHLYGRNVVTVEAYTYIHWESYRATLGELKIASDVFLRSGANKFYNHGYTCSPERGIAPSRRFESEVLISHSNVWWRYYRHLSDYVARCCCLLRLGSFAADIAIYSPLANQWTMDVRNARRWTRDFNWGCLGELLTANGYDFDLVNDDVLLHHAQFEEGVIRVRDLEYRILLLPNIRSMPLGTLERIRDWVRRGGVVVALERVPEASVGLEDHARRDEAVRSIAEEMFDRPAWRVNPTAPRDYGDGRTYHIRYVIDRSDVLERSASSLDPFLNVLRSHVKPDMGIDFVREGIRKNEGLCCIHRRSSDREIYFVANIQDRPVDTTVAFRVVGKSPWEWNPMDGSILPVHEYTELEDATGVRLGLAPYESTFIVFEGIGKPHVEESTLVGILDVEGKAVRGLARRNGHHRLRLNDGRAGGLQVAGIPATLRIDGTWLLNLADESAVTRMPELRSWTENPETEHFSGTGRYALDFDLPPEYIADDLRLHLDLGVVGNVAKVELNGVRIGVVWMRGQVLDVTEAAKGGPNQLLVDVTNTLINRVSGLKELPDVPDQLQERYGRDPKRGTAPSARLLGYGPLPNSGLLGPVVIHPLKVVEFNLARPSNGSGQDNLD